MEAAYCLGDFNANPNGRFGKELLSFCVENNLLCADIELLGIDSGEYTYISDAHHTKSWLDHCVVTQAAFTSITSVKVLHGVYWSDHVPLAITCDIEVILNSAQAANNNNLFNRIKWGNRDLNETNLYARICCDKLKRLRFSSQCLKCDIFTCRNHLYLVDKFYCDIVQVLQNAASISAGSRCLSKKRKVIGWNYHVMESHHDARFHFKRWIDAGKPNAGDLYSEMINSKRTFKNKLKWCQDNQEKIRMEVLALHTKNKNFISFWKDTKNLQGKPSMPISVEGARSPQDIAELFAKHFKIDPITTPSSDSSNIKNKRTDSNNNDITYDFSPEDIIRIVRSMSRGKSPGMDGLSIEHIIFAGPEIYRVLAQLFSLLLNFSYLPSDLMKTVVIPVPKNKTGNLSSLNNYRPISLGSILGKLLERLIYPELTQNVRIDDAQFGFRPGLSTDAAIFSLKHVINYYKSRSTSVYACFLDLSRAFDLVNYDLLWKKLSTSSVPLKVVSLLRYWYDNQTNCVRWGDSLSNEYRLDCGVRQGGLTSPDLFNLYMNDLIVELRKTKVGCHIGNMCINNLSYADDMVLLSPSINGLRRLISVCEQYAKEHGLIYNVNKSEMMVFKAGRGPLKVPPLYLNNTPVKRVERFKYLGHILNEHLTDDDDIERERRALAVRCNMLARRFAKCDVNVKNILFKTYCQNFYTCHLWTNFSRKAHSTIRVQYNDAYRILMKLPRYNSASNMFASAGVNDFFAIIRSRIASFWLRIRSSGNTILNTLSEYLNCPIFKYWTSVHCSGNRK